MASSTMCPDCTGQLGCPLSYPTNPGPFFHCLPTTTGSRRNSTSSNTKHFVASCVLQLRERLPGPGALNQNPPPATEVWWVDWVRIRIWGFLVTLTPPILSVHPTLAYLTLTPNRCIPSGILGTTPIAHYFFVHFIRTFNCPKPFPPTHVHKGSSIYSTIEQYIYNTIKQRICNAIKQCIYNTIEQFNYSAIEQCN